MNHVKHVIIGAGVTGLAFANRLPAGESWLAFEAEHEAGGWCRTVRRSGFVWDYSGHFFHFRRPEVEAYLRERMPNSRVRTVQKRASILYAGARIDFPFQKNIHQLPRDEFVECLYDLHFRDEEALEGKGGFEAMLYRKLGRGITEKFLKPYNEKLYACDLNALDEDAMGRFFPHADLPDIIRNMRFPDNGSYNATFTYPEGGAIEYVEALLRDLPAERVRLGEAVVGIDTEEQVVRTSKGAYSYDHLISSAPIYALADLCGLPFDRELHSYNKVLVFNLGFDRKGWTQDHWVYIPERDKCFYRVGFYDNIFDADRMSLYVEVGLRADDEVEVEPWLERVLSDLKRAGIVDGHQLVDWHTVTLDPAYVHIKTESQREVSTFRAALAKKNVHSVGRYGRWTYCSIEDNIDEAWRLADAIVGAS